MRSSALAVGRLVCRSARSSPPSWPWPRRRPPPESSRRRTRAAFSYDGEYRTQARRDHGVGAGQRGARAAVHLSGEELEVKLRSELAHDAAVVGLIPADGSQVSVVTKTWIALRGANTREGTQVIGPVSVTATTSAIYDESSQTIAAQPFAYTPPKLADTTWTGTGGDIAFGQAGANAIAAAKGQLPVGGGGSPVTVQGSAVVQATLPGGANFYMDCEPGETNVTRPEAGAGTTFNPLTAGPFAGVQVAGEPTNPGGTPPAGSGGPSGPAGGAALVAGGVASTALTAKAGRIAVRVRCAAGGPACAGSVTVRTRSKVKLGTRTARLVTLARSAKYALAAGTAKPVTLKLGLDGRKVLARRRTQKVTVTLKPATGAATTRTLTLRRG